MLFSLGLRFSILLALYVSVLPIISREAPGQTIPNAGPPQDAQSGSQPIAAKPRNLQNYLNFMTWVGEEDDRIQKGTGQGTPKIDYASAIGISKDEGDAVVAVLLDAYHKRQENERQFIANINKRIQEEGFEHYSANPDSSGEQKAIANDEVLHKTYAKLKEILGKPDFAKLDAYVGREFITEAPASLRAKLAPSAAPTFSSVPVDVKYEMFIRHVGTEQAMVHQGRLPPPDYNFIAHIPPNEQQPMLTILLEGNEQLDEYYRKSSDAFSDIRQRYGIVPVDQLPAQSQLQIQQLTEERKDIVERTVDRLKQELGQEYFNNLDAWVSSIWGRTIVYTPPRPTGTSSQIQLPAVKP